MGLRTLRTSVGSTDFMGEKSEQNMNFCNGYLNELKLSVNWFVLQCWKQAYQLFFNLKSQHSFVFQMLCGNLWSKFTKTQKGSLSIIPITIGKVYVRVIPQSYKKASKSLKIYISQSHGR